MPGIVGIIRKQKYDGIEQDLDAMLSAIHHESYYVRNRYVNSADGLYLGWTSYPQSLGQLMPLISSDGYRILILLGEEFSKGDQDVHRNGKSPLVARATNLLKLYETVGDEFIERMNGWFSGVAIDLGAHKATVFNDRYAMNRIYVHEGTEEFIFASEAKAILRIRPELRAIDPAALGQYLRFNCVMGNKTLFKGVTLLPAASSWVFGDSVTPQKRTYFTFEEWENQPILDPEDFYQKFRETTSAVFPVYMDAAQLVGLSLTAGLDTRVILAAGIGREGALPCYTFGGDWSETFDIQTARKLARIAGLRHEVIRTDDHFLQRFPEYARQSIYISDGTHDAFGAHDVYFNELARNIAPIRLTGKFGSEVVRTRRLIPNINFPRDLLAASFVPFLDKAPSFNDVSKMKNALSRTVAEEIPWYEYGRVAIEQSKVILRTPYMDNELVKLMYQAPLDLRSSRDLQKRYVKEEGPKLSDVPTNMGNSKLAYPLFWALFKAEYIYLFATPHWLTRIDRKLEKLKLEKLLVGRQKFEGYRIWIKTHFAEFIRDTLLDPRANCTNFFDRTMLTKVVIGHTAGTHNYLNEINKILTVELIYSSLLRP